MKTGKFAINVLFIIFILGGSNLLRAQPNTLYFMKGIPQTKDLNPARPGISEGYYFSMPLFSKLDLAANTNNWAYNDLIHWGTGTRSDSLVIDLDKFRGSLDNKNFVFESAALTILEGGFKKGKNFFAASLTEREFTQVFFSKNLVNLIQFGNNRYVGQTYYSGNAGVGAQHYREFAFNYSRDVTKKLTIGGAAKILFGMAAVQTNGMNFRISSPANGESLDVVATGRVNISAPVRFNYNTYGEITSTNSLPNYGLGDYLGNFQNPGIAFDMGFAYKVNKKTEVSVSIIDLGMIGWKSNVTRFTEQGHFLYKGIDLNDPALTPPAITQLAPAIDQLTNEISRAFRLAHTESNFSTLIPAKIYFGIDHQLNDIVNVSGLTRIRIINNRIHTSLTGSANAIFWERLSLSASYSIMESTFDNLGLGIGFRAGPFQLYTATDNLFSPFYPSKARNMNLRVGINFIFDGKNSGKGGKSGSSLNPNCHCPY